MAFSAELSGRPINSVMLELIELSESFDCSSNSDPPNKGFEKKFNLKEISYLLDSTRRLGRFTGRADKMLSVGHLCAHTLLLDTKSTLSPRGRF